MRTWLIDFRHKQNATEKEMADLLGIKQPHYHRIEHGEGNPSVQLAKKFGTLFGMDWTLFFNDERTKP